MFQISLSSFIEETCEKPTYSVISDELRPKLSPY